MTVRPDQVPPSRRALTRRLGLADDAVPMGGDWYTAEDVLIMLADQIAGRQPQSLVGLGAGLSTVIMACAAARSGGGAVRVLEHDPQVIEITRQRLARVGADAMLIEAELTDHGDGALWYARSALAVLPDRIDLLFIDGPPMFAGRTPRYPAAEHLFGRMAPDGLIVLDDAQRAKEKKTLRHWARDVPEFTQTKTRGGAVLLTRAKETPSP